MKFGQRLAANKVPAWENKYVRYDELKRLAKRIKQQSAAERSQQYPKSALHLQCVHCSAEVPVGDIEEHLKEHRQDRREEVREMLEGNRLAFDSDLADEHPVNEFWRTIVDDLHGVDQWFVHQMQRHEQSMGKAVGQIDMWAEQRSAKAEYNYALRRAKRLLSESLVEQYQMLALLLEYAKLNLEGTRKIVKKFDKCSNFVTVVALVEFVRDSFSFAAAEHIVADAQAKLELLYAVAFTDGDQSAARRALRKRQEVRMPKFFSFFTGFWLGASLILCVASLIAWAVQDSGASWPSSQTVFLLYRLWLWPIVGLWLFGANLIIWERGRVNFPFIFDHQPGRHLGHRDVFLLAALSTGLWSLSVASYTLSMTFGGPGFDSPLWHPVALSIVFVISLCLPFDVLFFATRKDCAFEVLRLFASGFVDVTLMDFFVADQLTSAVPLFEDALFQLCVISSDLWTGDQACLHDYLRIFKIAVGFLPSYMRLAQCLRRWRNEEGPHMANALKYLAQLPVVVFGGLNAFLSDGGFTVWTFLFISAIIVAQYFRLYWDYARDWHVLSPRSRAFPLRSKTLYPHYAYAIAIVTNFIMRHLWVFQVYTPPYPLIVAYPGIFSTMFGLLEIIRRFQWNIFRIENEQISNTGRYRIVKDIPLLYEAASSKLPNTLSSVFVDSHTGLSPLTHQPSALAAALPPPASDPGLDLHHSSSLSSSSSTPTTTSASASPTSSSASSSSPFNSSTHTTISNHSPAPFSTHSSPSTPVRTIPIIQNRDDLDDDSDETTTDPSNHRSAPGGL